MANGIYDAMLGAGADQNFVTWMQNKGIDPTNLTSADMKGLETDWLGSTGGINDQSWAQQNLGLSNMDALRGGLGIANLGLGALSYFDNKKTADKQRKLLEQQAEQNKYVLGQAKQRGKEIAGTFGGGGLAASVK
jgi:hypothetical protein